MLAPSRLAFSCVLLTICGCASTPPSTVSYYLPKATILVTATQKLSCNAAKTRAFVATTVDFTTTYSANYAAQALTFEPHKVDSVFSDSDIQISLYNDGRLKSINTTTEGKGDAVVKSVAAFAPLLLGAGTTDKKDGLPICQIIADFAGDAPATITYKNVLDFKDSSFPSQVTMEPSAESAALHGAINPPLANITVDIAVPKEIAPTVTPVSESSSKTVLKLPKLATVAITIKLSGETLGTEEALIPFGGTYTVPIPTAKAFGGTKFNLAIAESGVITAIGYAKTDGTASAISSGNTFYSSVVPNDTLKAQQLGAKIDLIVQRNRYAACIADPANCK